MSVWEMIEDAVVQALEQLSSGGSSLFATVKGRTSRERKQLIAALGRERLPAAYVITRGRESGDKTFRRSGSPTLSVLLGQRSLRSDHEVRAGSDEVTGIYELSEQVVVALQDQVVAWDRRLLLVDEQPAGGDEGTIIWEQRYEVRRLASIAAPTFGGVELAGTDSEVVVEVNELQHASSLFSFPGVDGVFRRGLGARERRIVWRGQMRAASNSILNAREQGIEELVRSGEAATMTDACGRSYPSCAVKAYRRCSPRQRDELSEESLQDFEIEFTQLLC